MFQTISDYLYSYLIEYIDIDFTLWLSWMLMPLILTFLLPMVILALFYTTAVILYVYKYWDRLKYAYENDFWDGARKTVAALWDAHGWIWHGYEIRGMENIPEDEAVLFVYYHGTLPVDLYYFIARIYLVTNKLIHTVGDRFLFNVPGWSIISEGIKVIPGTLQTCSAILKEGNSLAISPGGVFEAQFGGPDYRLMWKRRLGFAKVALDAKVSIVPMFTQNVREAFRNVTFGRRIWLKLYLKTRLPLVPIYGGFPVKLITHVGKPISYNVCDGTPEDLQKIVAKAISDLIDTHQKLPGSILRGVVERVYATPKPTELIKED
ncbi:transmembrane protein 68 [Cimex lectularius]|uniref:Phospholipid/glycerol acyltransferase domain-containing protein n=1 Tax=Cimex lectularius TaxID=79782 RepID=A0A8I6TC04_CIMLE|nr:transmembrane protein 68 [Cimex lectularius]XP_014242342.1 transmembrane protein 68 [Cimex lectularius]